MAGSMAGEVVPWVVSGRGAAGLAAQARRLAAFTAGRAGLAPEDVGAALAGRAALEDRAVVVGHRDPGSWRRGWERWAGVRRRRVW